MAVQSMQIWILWCAAKDTEIGSVGLESVDDSVEWVSGDL